MVLLTPRLAKAINTSALAHRNQLRKVSSLPYIVHPYAVMLIAGEVTSNEDVLIACLFHDIIEDVPGEYPMQQMSVEFGQNVVAIVSDVTKNDSILDWHERSKDYLDHIARKASGDALIVSAADKCHNLMSVVDDYQLMGEKLWSKFTTRSADDQLWWYESMLKVFVSRKVDSALTDRLASSLGELKTLIAQK